MRFIKQVGVSLILESESSSMNPAEKPVELNHTLKLYPDPGNPQTTKKPVVNERYEEIVFYEPTESFAMVLDNGPKNSGITEENKGKSIERGIFL